MSASNKEEESGYKYRLAQAETIRRPAAIVEIKPGHFRMPPKSEFLKNLMKSGKLPRYRKRRRHAH
jgi:hypothetical protein